MNDDLLYPMKVTYISESNIPSRTANSVHVMKMCQALRSNNHHVDLFVRGDANMNIKNIYKYYGINNQFPIHPVKYYKVKFIGSLIYSLKVYKDMQDVSIDTLIYARDKYSLYFLRNSNRRFIYEAHEVPKNIVHQFVLNKIFKSSNFLRLIVISEALKQQYKLMFPYLPDENIVVAHDGADIPKIENNVTKNDDMVNTRRLTVSYIGHLYKGRGIDLIINIAERMEDIDFYIVGGNEEDISYWKSRANLSNLKFVGYVPHGDLHKYFIKSDIFIAPYQLKISISRSNSNTARWMSPLKIFEYMSYEKPIIASNLPVLREVLENNKTALLVPPDDVNEWVVAINKLRDKEIRDMLGRNAKEIFLNNFTWSMRANKVLHGIDVNNTT